MAFNRWRARSLAFLEAELPTLHPYPRSFTLQVAASTEQPYVRASESSMASGGFMISKLEDPENAALLIEANLRSWGAATPL